jgi:4-amino-4-deoxy-L-arabinose transferase-like glycosyltransferase
MQANSYITKVLNTIRRHRYLLYILAIIPLFVFRDYTKNNELRYLSIADEAINNGSLFAFTNHGIPYADKPPLYFWIVMLGKIVFGTHSMLFLALFSYVPALVIIWIMGKWTKNYTSGQNLLAGELMLLTSVFFMGSAVVLRMDMLMCMFIVLSLYTFFRIYTDTGEKGDRWMFPVYVFLALFSKGPVGILVPLVTTIVFLIIKGEAKIIGKFWGLRTFSVLFVLSALWFSAVYIEGGKEYLDNLLFNQTINRAVDSFHHKEPFYYYFVAYWYSLAPWSLLIAGILTAGIRTRISKKQIPGKQISGFSDLELLFISAAFSTFILLSLISSKIQIYLLPAFPFFVYLTVLWLQRFERSLFTKIFVTIPALIYLLALPCCIIIKSFTDLIPYSPAWIFISSGLLTLSGCLALYYTFREGRQIQNSIITLGAGLMVALFSISFTIPGFNPQIGMGTISKEAKSVAKKLDITEYLFYKIPRAENMDVYLGTVPREITFEELSKKIKDPESAGKRAILFVSHKEYLKSRDLENLLRDRERFQIGPYLYIIL